MGLYRRLEEGAFSTEAKPITISAAELSGRIIGAVVLLGFSALFSGLTLGLLGLDTNQLEIVRESGTPDERKYAQSIIPIRKRGNLLLCTLVTGNVAVISLQSILLADITGGLVGFLLSTLLTVLFGEIIPQAVCNRHGLYLGAKAIPIISVIMFLLWPITAPLAAVLDYALGEELGHFYSKTEFLTLVKMHLASKRLDKREAGIIGGAIAFRDKKVVGHMTPAERMFTLSETDRLDYSAMEAIFRAGYSRLPVLNAARTDVVGVLLTKDLLLLSPNQCHSVAAVVAFFGREFVLKVDAEDTLESCLQSFMASHQHAAIVTTVDSSGPGDPTFVVAGIITLEDVLEEILGEEIRDEFDAMRGHGLVGDRPAEAAAAETGVPSSPSTAMSPGASSRKVSGRAQKPPALRRSESILFSELSGGGYIGGVAGFGRAERVQELARESTLRAAYAEALDPGELRGRITASEAAVVAAHLVVNCAPFARFAPAVVAQLVLSADVVDAVAVAPRFEEGGPQAAAAAGGATVAAAEARLSDLRPQSVLYTRGRGSNVCTVVLQGELDVVAGEDAVASVARAWDVLGQRALGTALPYVPDFSARPRTPIARVLRISRALFDSLSAPPLGAPEAAQQARARAGRGSVVLHVGVNIADRAAPHPRPVEVTDVALEGQPAVELEAPRRDGVLGDAE
jgi:metal transporter CNNM